MEQEFNLFKQSYGDMSFIEVRPTIGSNGEINFLGSSPSKIAQLGTTSEYISQECPRLAPETGSFYLIIKMHSTSN